MKQWIFDKLIEPLFRKEIFLLEVAAIKRALAYQLLNSNMRRMDIPSLANRVERN